MVLAASALAIAVWPQSAVAHNFQIDGGRYTYHSGNFCVRGTGYQNHTYSGFTIYTEGPCSYVKYR